MSTGAWIERKERRRSSAYKLFLGDYQHVLQNPTLLSSLEKSGEPPRVLFADTVVKVNRKNKMQDRLLILTDSALFNIEPGTFKVKRRIALGDISAVSLSCYADNYFVVHVPSELDYLLISPRKIEFVSRLAAAAEAVTHSSLEVRVGPSIELRIEVQGTREISFTKVESGVSATIYVHQGPH